ncbi:hypothetical protein OC188_04485 [Anaplasma capra]|uniref:hypothetical protein n=1 Tax=Anaplasma capra TaxID=1562740 RepID=UPI0021D60040|nr:hypothetical protein [Anaplasma capra]MCU7611944.1 hypothetical protein [Anaplasma capra]
MSELFLSLSGSGNGSRSAALQAMLANDPGLRRNFLAVVSLAKEGLLKIEGQDLEFAGCKVRFARPEHGKEELLLVLETDVDSTLSSLLSRFAPDDVHLTDTSIENARITAGVSVVVSDAESVHNLFSCIAGVIDSGNVSLSSQEEGGDPHTPESSGLCGVAKNLLNKIPGRKTVPDSDGCDLLTAIFGRYLDYYMTRAINYIDAGGHATGGNNEWRLGSEFLHTTVDGRALLYDELNTGILSKLYYSNAFVSPAAGVHAKHRAALLSAVLKAISDLPQNIKDEVIRDSSTKKRSGANFLCACSMEVYASNRHVSAAKSNIRILDMMKSVATDFPDRYQEAAGILAISCVHSPSKKHNKDLIDTLLKGDVRFPSIYDAYDNNGAKAGSAQSSLLEALRAKYARVKSLMRSCGVDPPPFHQFCTCSFFESLLPLLECFGNGFQIDLPIQIDNGISAISTSQGPVFGQQVAVSGEDLDTDAELLEQFRRPSRAVFKFYDGRVRKACIALAVIIVVSVVALCVVASLYSSGKVSAYTMSIVGAVIGITLALSVIGLVILRSRSGHEACIAGHQSATTLTLCVNILDRNLFQNACAQQSISYFGIANGKLCMGGRPVPQDKYKVCILGAEDELPHGMCILFRMNAMRDHGDLELLKAVSGKAMWPKDITTDMSFSSCPYMGASDCGVLCNVAGKWSSRASHMALMKVLARTGRVGPLLAYLDTYVDLMCPENGNGSIDAKFRTSMNWKLMYRDHVDFGIITAIYQYCGMYLEERRRACLKYITSLLQVHDAASNSNKYKHISDVHLLVKGPGFPFSGSTYLLALRGESCLTFDAQNWFLSQVVPVQFTGFMCSDDHALICPPGIGDTDLALQGQEEDAIDEECGEGLDGSSLPRGRKSALASEGYVAGDHGTTISSCGAELGDSDDYYLSDEDDVGTELDSSTVLGKTSRLGGHGSDLGVAC